MFRVQGHRIFLKYLLTYLIILLLPTMMLMFVVYQAFIDRLQEEVFSGNLNMLEKTRFALDEQLKRVEDITYQMVLEENRLSQYRISDHPGYRAWGIVSELKRYTASHSFVHEVWLYYRGDSSIYTSKSVYDLNVFTSQIYPFEKWNAEQMVADLNDSKQTLLILPSALKKGQERYMEIVVPILPYQSKPYATLVYMIRESDVRRILSSNYDTGSSTWIFDSQNRLITGVDTLGQEVTDQVAQLLEAEDTESYKKVWFGKEEFYLFVLKSPYNGWKYVTLLPVSLVLDKVQQAQKFSIYGMILILILGSIIVFYGMKWNYRPIRQLKLLSENMLSGKTKVLNELETIRYAIESLVTKNRELDERVKSHSGLVKRQWLLSLLRGQVKNEEDLRMLGSETGFPISGSRFRVGVLKWATHSSYAQKISSERVEALLPEPLIGFGMEHPDPGRFILLLITDGLNEEMFQEGMKVLWESLRADAMEGVTIGIGSSRGVADIPNSYLEADTALSYRFVKGTDRLIHFADIPNPLPMTEHYPKEAMQLLYQSIKMGHTSKVQECLNEMMNFIREEQPSLFVARGLCLEVIRTVNNAWVEMDLDDDNMHRYPDVFSLEHIETLDAFEQLIGEVCHDLCMTMNQNLGDTTSNRSLESMQEYIMEHYQSCDFSFQTMAIDFGMALSNLSQLFKDQAGMTLLEYTTKLRMEKAKELLVNTDDALKVVAESVGYYNVSSFIRRFKQLTGMTPGEYRQLSKKQLFLESSGTVELDT